MSTIRADSHSERKAENRIDVDEMMAFFTDDAEWHNMPMAPCVGREAIREMLAGFAAMMQGLRIEVSLRQLREETELDGTEQGFGPPESETKLYDPVGRH